MTRTPPTPNSFGPEIMAALIEGSKRKIEISLPYRRAVQFRHRANSLRASMRHHNHPMTQVVASTKLTILWGKDAGQPSTPERKNRNNVRFPSNPDTMSKLVISPADQEFADLLRDVGVTVPELSEPSPNTEQVDPPTEAPAEESVEDMLARYVRGEADAQ